MTTNTQDEGDSWVGVENSSVICCIPKPFPWPRMLVSHFLYPACGLVDHFLYICLGMDLAFSATLTALSCSGDSGVDLF